MGGELLVEHQQAWIGAGQLVPVLAERDHLAGLGGFGDVGVGEHEVVGAGVLGEERQHRPGALRAAGNVVFLQGRVLAPVHDRVEVEVEVGAVDQPRLQHRLIERDQERVLALVRELVGVAGQRGRLRQRGEPGEQGRAVVGGEILDVRGAADVRELERQQRQDR